MRDIVQKALSAMSQRRMAQNQARRRNEQSAHQPAPSEDWGMSPEDALRANTVAHYK